MFLVAFNHSIIATCYASKLISFIRLESAIYNYVLICILLQIKGFVQTIIASIICTDGCNTLIKFLINVQSLEGTSQTACSLLVSCRKKKLFKEPLLVSTQMLNQTKDNVSIAFL